MPEVLCVDPKLVKKEAARFPLYPKTFRGAEPNRDIPKVIEKDGNDD